MPTFVIGKCAWTGAIFRDIFPALGQRTGNARSGTRQNHRENKIGPFPGLWVSNRGLFDRPTLCGFDSGYHLTKYGINPRTISR